MVRMYVSDVVYILSIHELKPKEIFKHSTREEEKLIEMTVLLNSNKTQKLVKYRK